MKAYASITATLREISYPHPFHLNGRISRYFSPPPLGRCIVILLYWLVILLCLWNGSILHPGDALYAYKWEKVGFRAAWVSVTQLPLIYLLSCKANPITLLTGISYERLNWIHRWSAITLFFTVIVHWSYFYTEWSLGQIVSMELEMMPMVKYGFGAWGVITWMVLSSWGFFRHVSYEFFVVQHIVAAFVLLWLVHMHVPSYAAYNVWIAVGFVVFDWSARGLLVLIRNSKKSLCGYNARLEPAGKGVTKVTIEGVRFSWSAGQHIYIYAPGSGWIGNHPFTIANAQPKTSNAEGNEMTLLVKAHSGMTKRLNRKARSSEGARTRVFLSGPWGVPPDLKIYDTLVLIASGTGVAFTMPVLQEVLQSQNATRSVEFSWIIRNEEEADSQRDQLIAVVAKAKAQNISLRVTVYVTCSEDLTCSCCKGVCTCGKADMDLEKGAAITYAGSEISSSSSSGCCEKKAKTDDVDKITTIEKPISDSSRDSVMSDSDTRARLLDGSCCQGPSICRTGRPSADQLIRPAVESAYGETAVVVCGDSSLIATVRSYVAKLSDERAVHKGTGAQGLYLFSESYDW